MMDHKTSLRTQGSNYKSVEDMRGHRSVYPGVVDGCVIRGTIVLESLLSD